MKNIILFVIISLLLGNTHSLADCHTGFACSIKDLNKKNIEQTNKTIKIIKNYFKKSDYIHFGNKKLISNNYNDLFLFHTTIN